MNDALPDDSPWLNRLVEPSAGWVRLVYRLAIGRQLPPSHYRQPTASRAMAPQIAAQKPNDSSNIKISASPWLNRSDRTDGQARSDPILLSISSSLNRPEQTESLFRITEVQPLR
jgi:hypothetical protein